MLNMCLKHNIPMEWMSISGNWDKVCPKCYEEARSKLITSDRTETLPESEWSTNNRTVPAEESSHEA